MLQNLFYLPILIPKYRIQQLQDIATKQQSYKTNATRKAGRNEVLTSMLQFYFPFPNKDGNLSCYVKKEVVSSTDCTCIKIILQTYISFL